MTQNISLRSRACNAWPKSEALEGEEAINALESPPFSLRTCISFARHKQHIDFLLSIRRLLTWPKHTLETGIVQWPKSEALEGEEAIKASEKRLLTWPKTYPEIKGNAWPKSEALEGEEAINALENLPLRP
ncbi:hypothetical protein Tco_0344670 [Tanacetum coccineum]